MIIIIKIIIIYNNNNNLGPFLASFMVSSSRVCRTIWTPHKIPMGLSRTILLCDKNPLKIIRNYMRNTKNTINHLWNYLQNQTKSLGTIWKNTQNSTGIMLKLIKIWRGLHDIYVFTFAQNRKFWYFSGEPPLNIKPSCQHQRHHSNTFWKLPSTLCLSVNTQYQKGRIE